jgi:carotenoid cleavage dioxygenase-like enzyme
VRNGPGALSAGSQPLKHWFDGLAMLHKFSFANQQVSYASKFIDSSAYQQAQARGGLAMCEFATDPCRSLFKKVMTLFSRHPTDNAKVNIAKFADRFYALGETPIQVEFDAETLRSVGVFLYEQNPIGQMTTAHPHFDDGMMYNVVTRFHRVSHYHAYKAKQVSQQQRIAAVPTHAPSYMHSFGMSQNHIIITEFPYVVNPLNLLLWLKPFIENYKWRANKPTVFWVINRHTGEIVGRYESEPFFAFHHVNAFEQNGEVVIDLVAYPDAGIVSDFYLNRLRSADLKLPAGNLRRYRVRPRRKQVTQETLSETCIEMPRFDYSRFNMCADYRYVYGIGVEESQPHGFYNQIVKIDALTGQTTAWHTSGCYPGEPVFVPAPHARAEDDGVLLSVVLDVERRYSFLLVLDAATLEEQARAFVPQGILFGFHGEYIGA